jgi:hypothetical protein
VRDVGFHLWVAIGHGSKLAQVFRPRAEALPPFEAIALAAQTLEDLLRALPVLPEVRLGGFGL